MRKRAMIKNFCLQVMLKAANSKASINLEANIIGNITNQIMLFNNGKGTTVIKIEMTKYSSKKSVKVFKYW